MCGLFGFAGRLPKRQRASLLRSLCVQNQDRGRDSVGLARISAGEQPKLSKALGLAVDIVTSNEFNDVARDDGHVWIGHTRQATRGEVTVDNAHPYHMGQTVLAHNGMVSIDKDMIDRCDGHIFPVDSQYLAYLINRDDELGEIDGSACLTFSKAKAAADVSLVRFHNPLTIAYVNGYDGLAWSSTHAALRASLASANIRKYRICDIRDFPDCTRIDVYLGADGRVGNLRSSDAGAKTKSRSIGYNAYSGYDYDGYDSHYGNGKEVHTAIGGMGRNSRRNRGVYPPVCGLGEQKALPFHSIMRGSGMTTTQDSSMADTQIIDDDDGRIWIPGQEKTPEERALWEKLQEMELRERSESMRGEDIDMAVDIDPSEISVVPEDDDDQSYGVAWGLPEDIDEGSCAFPRNLR